MHPNLLAVQREILPFVLATETAERFYSKPRGYAGDFLAIDMIYANQPRGAGRIGPQITTLITAVLARGTSSC